jgi:hypothetical protein
MPEETHGDVVEYSFIPLTLTHLLTTRPKPKGMESYWSKKKNSIVNWKNNGVDFSPALLPCIKVECDQWRNGECIQIRTTGKPERPHVFSKQDPGVSQVTAEKYPGV